MNVSSTASPSVQSTQRPTQLQKSEQDAGLQARRQESEVNKSEAPKPVPVVNTQGQTTGRLLNVTA